MKPSTFSPQNHQVAPDGLLMVAAAYKTIRSVLMGADGFRLGDRKRPSIQAIWPLKTISTHLMGADDCPLHAPIWTHHQVCPL